MCVLIGYGADAICPYMVFELAQMLNDQGVIDIDDQTAYDNYAAAIDRGTYQYLIGSDLGSGDWTQIGQCICTVLYTVWKFHHFSIAQILCEINFGDSRIAKYVIFDAFCTF